MLSRILKIKWTDSTPSQVLELMKRKCVYIKVFGDRKWPLRDMPYEDSCDNVLVLLEGKARYTNDTTKTQNDENRFDDSKNWTN